MTDPLSAAGLGLSVTSLFLQVFAGSIKGIQLILAIKDIPKDYQKLRLRLELELNRLICWGEAVGLLKELEDEGLVRQTTLNVTITGPLRHTVQDLIEILWAEVGKITREPPKFYQKHSGGSSVSISRPESSPSKSSKIGRSQRSSLETLFQKVWFGGIKFKDRLVWTSIGADKLEHLICSLQHVNSTVIGLTETKTQQEIHHTVTATNIGLLSLQNSVADLKQLIEALQISSTVQAGRLGVLSPPALPQQNEDVQLLLDLAELKARRKACISGDVVQIDRRSLSGLKAIDADNHRHYATYERSRGYWVEWKAYPADYERHISPSKEDIRRYIVHELVNTLNSNQPAAFRVPRCIGYFDDPSRSRFGLVFKKPDTVPTQARISTLAERFDADPHPDLADRISLARAVAQTVYYLHAVDWLHKAIRPQNIVFAAKWHGPVQYDSPLITGFDYSRPAYSLDMTQEPSGESSYDDDLYRHPSVQLCNANRRSGGYRKTYDVYSLGIVLVEIALWKPVRTLFRSPGQYHMTRTWLLDEKSGYLRNVKFAAGRAYHDVVRTCLLGLGEEGEAGRQVAKDEDGEDQNFMFDFERLIVRKLQQIIVA